MRPLPTPGARGWIVLVLVASTALTAFRVTMWLAPDACLLAGCAVSLLVVVTPSSVHANGR